MTLLSTHLSVLWFVVLVVGVVYCFCLAFVFMIFWTILVMSTFSSMIVMAIVRVIERVMRAIWLRVEERKPALIWPR